MKDLEVEDPPGGEKYSSTNGHSSSETEDDYILTDDQRKATLELQSLYRKLGLEDFDDGFEEGYSAYDDPQFDIVGRLRDVNTKFDEDPTPLESDRLRKVRFKESVVDLVVPISPVRSAFDKEFDYSDPDEKENDYYQNYYGSDDFESDKEWNADDINELHDRLLSDDEEDDNINNQSGQLLEDTVHEHNGTSSADTKRVIILVPSEKKSERKNEESEINLEKTMTNDLESSEEKVEEKNDCLSVDSNEQKKDDEVGSLSADLLKEEEDSQIVVSHDTEAVQNEENNSEEKEVSVRSKTIKPKNKNANSLQRSRPRSAPENNNSQTIENKQPKARPSSSVAIGNSTILFHDRSRPVKPDKLLPTYKGNSRSKYGVSEELKRELRKLKNLEAFQKKLKENEQSEERKRKREEAEAAFNAWLNQKKVTDKKPKDSKSEIKSPSKKPSKVSFETEQAFMQWWEQKQNQLRKEKVLQKLQEDEMNGNNPKTRREQSRKEYRKWLKRKNIQKRHQLALQSQLLQMPCHLTLSLPQAIQQAEMLKRTFQAYFGSSLW